MTVLARIVRPPTVPKLSTSGRSKSKGSDCRTLEPKVLVPGRLGPGSANMKDMSESRETELDVALNAGSGAYALVGRTGGFGGSGTLGTGGVSDGPRKGFSAVEYMEAVKVDGGCDRSAVCELVVRLCCWAFSRSHSGVPLPLRVSISSNIEAKGSFDPRSDMTAGTGVIGPRCWSSKPLPKSSRVCRSGLATNKFLGGSPNAL